LRLQTSDATASKRLSLSGSVGDQLATNKAWGKCNLKSDVQPLAYDDVREQTDFGSQHAILATHQAAQAITGCLERRSNGKKVSKPTFTTPTVKYDTRTMTLFDDETVSLPLRRVASGVTLLCPRTMMATSGSTSTPTTGASRKVHSPPVTASSFYISASAEIRPTPSGIPPRTERFSGLTSASKTSPSLAPPTLSADGS
jgi:hypothetical protein